MDLMYIWPEAVKLDTKNNTSVLITSYTIHHSHSVLTISVIQLTDILVSDVIQYLAEIK